MHKGSERRKKKADAQWGYRIHDAAAEFRFELEGHLAAADVTELEQCWLTAASTIGGKVFIVDVQALTGMDEAGRQLLDRWAEAGATFVGGSQQARAAGSGFLQSALRISIALIALLLFAAVWPDSGRTAPAPAAAAGSAAK